MESERAQPEKSPCDRIMELQSRKQMIEHWLATVNTPAFSSVMQEMLTSVEAELIVLRHRHFATKYPATDNNI